MSSSSSKSMDVGTESQLHVLKYFCNYCFDDSVLRLSPFSKLATVDLPEQCKVMNSLN